MTSTSTTTDETTTTKTPVKCPELTEVDLEDSEDEDQNVVENFQVSRTRAVSNLESRDITLEELEESRLNYRSQASSITGKKTKEKISEEKISEEKSGEEKEKTGEEKSG